MKCKDCNKCIRDRRYTKDSWEEEYDWKCGLKDNKIIKEWVAWNETNRVETPSWCPCNEFKEGKLSIDESREQFERSILSAFKSSGLLEVSSPELELDEKGNYRNEDVQMDWKVWKRCLRANNLLKEGE